MARLDPHSYNDASQPEVARLSWKARVDFDSRVLEAEAALELREAAKADGPLDLDTRDLTVDAVTDESGKQLDCAVSGVEPILGSRLRLQLPKGTRRVHIRYRTSPNATALQWLTPAQTAGGRHPFLFSQCQSIHARSVVPVQDTPRVRIRYDAELTIPKALRAVMAAGFVGREEKGDEAVERYQMPQPIPPYLFALAVAISSRASSGRARACGPSRRSSRGPRTSSVEWTRCSSPPRSSSGPTSGSASTS